CHTVFVCVMIRRPPRSTLSPYTTLSRSGREREVRERERERGRERDLGCLCRSEEHTSELQLHLNLVCRLLLEKKDCSVRGWSSGGMRRVCTSGACQCDVYVGEACVVMREVDGCLRDVGRRRAAAVFLNDAAPPEIYPLPLHDALPI